MSAATVQTWRRVRSAMACTGCKCLPEIATGAKRPRNDTSGWCRGAPAPLRGLIALYRALNERRYSPNLAACSFGDGLYGLQMPSRDCTPRALPRASRSGRHVASLLAMTNRGPLPFYRYPIRIGGAVPGAACRSPTAHGRRSVYFSFFIFQSSVFISMRPSPTTHYRFLASGVDFSCASCSARMMRFETSQPRGVRYQREPLCAARPCPAKRSSSCCSGAKGSR